MRAATKRPWAIAHVVFLALCGGVTLFGGCVETRRSLGEDCLKDDDCLSGVCSQLVCAALPPTIDAALVADVAQGNDAGMDAIDAPTVVADEDSAAAEATLGNDADQTADAASGPATDSTDDSSGE
ncbi:MAG: hypothetical protein WBY94_30355 [Polyangiaceae bacterium]